MEMMNDASLESLCPTSGCLSESRTARGEWQPRYGPWRELHAKWKVPGALALGCETVSQVVPYEPRPTRLIFSELAVNHRPMYVRRRCEREWDGMEQLPNNRGRGGLASVRNSRIEQVSVKACDWLG